MASIAYLLTYVNVCLRRYNYISSKHKSCGVVSCRVEFGFYRWRWRWTWRSGFRHQWVPRAGGDRSEDGTHRRGRASSRIPPAPPPACKTQPILWQGWRHAGSKIGTIFNSKIRCRFSTPKNRHNFDSEKPVHYRLWKTSKKFDSENPAHISTPKTGKIFHSENPATTFDSETDMAKKVDDNAVAAALFVSVVGNRNKKERKRNRIVFTPILYYLQTIQTKTMNFNQSQLFLSFTCFRKSTSE